MLRRTGAAAVLAAFMMVFAQPAQGHHLKQRYTALHHAAKKKDMDVGRNIRKGIRYRWVSSNHRGRHWNTRPATYKDYAKAIRKLRRLLWTPPIPGHLHAIARCESGGNPGAVSSTGKYRGLFQFDYGTWASVGGTGDPAAASRAEQYKRAAMLYARRGAQPWPVCGR